MKKNKIRYEMSHSIRERFFGETKSVTILGLAVALIILVFSLVSPSFTVRDNIMSVLRQSSTVLMLAFGQTMMLLLGGIDLSQANLASLVSITSTMVMTSVGTSLGIIVGLLTGALFGGIMGFIVTKGGVQPFVVTLGMQFTCLGIAYIISDGQVVYNLPENFKFFGIGMVGFVPVPVIIAILTAVALHIMLSRTTLGRSIYAIGGNKLSARLSGIAVDRTKIVTWIINGVLISMGGLILTARVNSGQPELAGSDYLMQSIASTVIGGTSFSGGRGGIIGTALGVLFICILMNGLSILGINQFIRQIVLGIIILAAVIKFKKNKSNS